ncbi:metallophosphoesterase [Archangium violaceum]|uniref:metallophosphoesterase n=1 Tax=Archangium violaceum TaxID=83451 RepID=UPI000B2AD4D6|nr:metallophosphoesterase [Archangium violaceum]
MPSDPNPPDLILVSDLHLGRGRLSGTGRYHALETFFFDEDFLDFCQGLVAEAEQRRTPFRLIFNGDTFDLLRIEPAHVGPSAARRERRFGAPVTPEVAAEMMTSILAGHPAWVEAVALVLAAGHGVLFLPGNHDVELQWEPVQRPLREAVAEALRRRGAGVEEALGRLVFEPWFHHEPGRIWVEHGSQYDPECSFRYPLRAGQPALWDGPALERDMPLGNFFQRYLYNAFGAITFIVPSTRANSRYLRWLVWNRPGLLLRVLSGHGPFSLQLLRRVAMTAGGMSPQEEAHRAELERLAAGSGLGRTLHDIDALKHVPPNLAQAARAVVWPLARLVLLALTVGLGGFGLWFAAFGAITHLQAGLGFKTVLFLGMHLALMAVLLGGLAWRLLRAPAAPPRPLRRAAGHIARLLGVPIVTFGHIHEEVVAPLDTGAPGAATYFNTGTWISVFTHEPLLPRERIQFSFLRVRGHQAELLHWSPSRGRAVPAILFEEDEHAVEPGVRAA